MKWEKKGKEIEYLKCYLYKYLFLRDTYLRYLKI